MSSFIVGDEVTRFCPTPDEWDKIAETVTARRGGAGWSDKTGDQIIADLMRMKKNREGKMGSSGCYCGRWQGRIRNVAKYVPRRY